MNKEIRPIEEKAATFTLSEGNAEAFRYTSIGSQDYVKWRSPSGVYR